MAFAGGDGVFEQAIEISWRDDAMLDFFARQHHRTHAAIFVIHISAVGPVNFHIVPARALRGPIGLGTGDQHAVSIARMDARGHLIDKGLWALTANGFIDQRIGCSANIARQRAGKVGVMAVRVRCATD